MWHADEGGRQAAATINQPMGRGGQSRSLVHCMVDYCQYHPSLHATTDATAQTMWVYWCKLQWCNKIAGMTVCFMNYLISLHLADWWWLTCRPTSCQMQAFTCQNGTETLHILYINRAVSDISQLSLHSAVLQPRCADPWMWIKDPHMHPQHCAILDLVSSHLQMQFISDRSSTWYLLNY